VRAWLPNALTLSRLLVGLFLYVAPPGGTALLALFAWAALTDCLDGSLARRFEATSRFGAAFDLSADGIFFVAAYLAIWRNGLLPGVLLAIIFGLVSIVLAAQAVRVLKGAGIGSQCHVCNRALGVASYAFLLAVAAGLPPVPLAVPLVLVQIWAHG